MSWRDQLGPAKFKGVPFFVDTVEQGGGRRVVKHEFPKRDKRFAEDMGRKGRAFPVEGYVIGADYFTARNALLDALEGEGSGELIHPYYGTRRVIAETYRVRESSRDGGMAVFSIEFEETEETPSQPSSVVNAPAAAQESALSARDAAITSFGAKYDVTAQPLWSLDSLAAVVTGAAGALSGVLAPIVADAQQLASLNAQLDGIISDAALMVADPGYLAVRLTDMFQNLDSFPLGRAGIKALLSVYGFAAGDRPPATTSARQAQQANFDALQQLLQQLILLEAAYLAPVQVYDSYDDSVSTRDSLTALLDDQAALVSDDLFPALTQLRADLITALPGDAEDLPRLITFTPTLTLPSLVLAHQLYGSVDLEADLLKRNDIRQPGFIPGGQALEVLSNG